MKRGQVFDFEWEGHHSECRFLLKPALAIVALPFKIKDLTPF